MASLNSSILLLLLSFFLPLFSFAASQPTYVYHDCPNTTTFALNTAYQRNLNSVLSSLSANATRPDGFLRLSAGNSPDAVYSLYLCRGDLSVRACQTCVDTARREITRRCPVEKVSIIFYDECMLRYSDTSFFSMMQENPMFRFYNETKISDTSHFLDVVFRSVGETADKAANNPSSGKKFATGKSDFTSTQTLYTLAQCTPDLAVSDCDRCLKVAIGNLPSDGSRGGRMLLPSCTVRFELFPFYNETAVPSPTVPDKGSRKLSSSVIAAIFAPIGFSVLLLILGCYLIRRRARAKYNTLRQDSVKIEISSAESLQFDLATIQTATDNFSHQNKLGEGGFGEVYKGRLLNGEEIAVKRLSKSSVQGAVEFKNEVVLVAKLQHRNLVRLLGFCYEGEEKILVYEFVPNKSLDYFLFGPKNQGKLDWSRRYKIIGGIARGMLYLHEDSRLRIIHRDLKASNILLDGDMSPKISDFGMARIFGVDQTQGTTNRIVGTYGYMSPEYAMQGYFSVKSDVYSFGVLVLEIISGQKNSNFHGPDGSDDLLSYAWKKWKDGAPLDFVDPSIRDSCSRNEVMRCLHLALLCVQESPSNRPMMATIVLMLDSHSVSLALPQRPAYILRSRTDSYMPIKDSDFDTSISKSVAASVNELSITGILPR